MLNCVTASAINARFCETDTVSIFLFPFLVVLGKPSKPGIWGEGLKRGTWDRTRAWCIQSLCLYLCVIFLFLDFFFPSKDDLENPADSRMLKILATCYRTYFCLFGFDFGIWRILGSVQGII